MKQGGRPGVVVDHDRAMGMRGRCNRAKIRHLEGLRAGGFDQHRPGVGLEQARNPRADHRIEIGGFDAIARQQAVAEIARGPIDIVANQQMVAGLENCEQGCGDRCEARRGDADTGTLWSFKRHQGLLQGSRRRGTMTAVLELAAMGMQVIGRWIKHRGTVDDGRINESLLRRRVAPRGHQCSFDFQWQAAFVAGGGHFSRGLLQGHPPAAQHKSLRSNGKTAQWLIAGQGRLTSTP